MEDFDEELPDDDFLAFVQLHNRFREEYDEACTSDDSHWTLHASRYISQTVALAKALNIEELAAFDVPMDPSDSSFNRFLFSFERAVEALTIQRRVLRSRRKKELSVGLTAAQKAKIHSLLDKVRQEVEASSANVAKKEKLFTIIAKLQAEVDKQRTGMERFGDLARGLSGISKDVAEEGAEPWWKWFKAALGVVDDAKEAEPQLPKPPEVKRIEPPKPPSVDDDEIPF